MDPGTIGLLVAEGAALAAISAAYSLGRPKNTASVPAPAPAPAPEVTTATPEATPEVTTATPEVTTATPEVTTTEQPSGADPAPVAVNVPPEPEKTLDEIVNEAILKAQSDQYMPDRGTVFQRLNPLSKVNAAFANRKTAIETRKQQQAGRKRTFRIRRGGEVTFEKRVSSKLYSLKPSDPRPQTAFKTLVTVKEDRVATLLLPVFNAFMWWRFKVQTMPLRYSPVLVADADSLFQDALKFHEDIHPVFLDANRAFKAEWMKVGKNPFLAETNPFASEPVTQPEPVPEPVVTSEPVPEPVVPPAEPVPEPAPEPVVPPAEPVTQTEPVPEPVPEPVVPPAEPVPEPVVPPAEPVPEPAPEPVVPPAEPVTQTEPVPEPVTQTEPIVPPAEPEPVPEPIVVPAEPELARPSSPINASPLDESISTADTLEIPPELQLKLNAAREKFESLRRNVELEEKTPTSPLFKSKGKKDRSKAARKAADTRKRNQLLAREDAIKAKQELQIKRDEANKARAERANKRAGIITPIETLLESTETSTNDVAEILEKERPTSASQNWFIDIETELQMYFDYYNQVERDLADVPPPKQAPVSDILDYANKAIEEGKKGLQKAKQKQDDAKQRLKTLEQGWKRGGTPRRKKVHNVRQSTFRRSRKD